MGSGHKLPETTVWYPFKTTGKHVVFHFARGRLLALLNSGFLTRNSTEKWLIYGILRCFTSLFTIFSEPIIGKITEVYAGGRFIGGADLGPQRCLRLFIVIYGFFSVTNRGFLSWFPMGSCQESTQTAVFRCFTALSELTFPLRSTLQAFGIILWEFILGTKKV